MKSKERANKQINESLKDAEICQRFVCHRCKWDADHGDYVLIFGTEMHTYCLCKFPFSLPIQFSFLFHEALVPVPRITGITAHHHSI